ncbi:MAG TPA: acetyl-CoA carboxylase biotin carboxyl carrier protein subunit [Cerasibacillus sp.]|uniref:acetyl-CoA carboxylase biotin carboxyl carrier protein subunit n=1 Tax=Cerasibacillus sp. TaxID=2498711 RepID=UPI002F41184E
MKEITASMAGSVWKVLVQEGDQVESDQDVVILESMKMEIPIAAEDDGVVKELKVQEGDFVNEGDVLITLE